MPTVSCAKETKNGNSPQTGRHVSPSDIPFHRRRIIAGGKSRKGHTHFFEAKVAVPHRSARPGPAGRRGKIILALCAPVFFLPSLDAFPEVEQL